MLLTTRRLVDAATFADALPPATPIDMGTYGDVARRGPSTRLAQPSWKELAVTAQDPTVPARRARRVQHRRNGPNTAPIASPTPAGATADEGPVTLYTPGEAAEMLRVRESWLRRKAGERTIPCTFIGKHLRFSRANLRAIIDAGNHPTRRT